MTQYIRPGPAPMVRRIPRYRMVRPRLPPPPAQITPRPRLPSRPKLPRLCYPDFAYRFRGVFVTSVKPGDPATHSSKGSGRSYTEICLMSHNYGYLAPTLKSPCDIVSRTNPIACVQPATRARLYDPQVETGLLQEYTGATDIGGCNDVPP